MNILCIQQPWTSSMAGSRGTFLHGSRFMVSTYVSSEDTNRPPHLKNRNWWTEDVADWADFQWCANTQILAETSGHSKSANGCRFGGGVWATPAWMCLIVLELWTTGKSSGWHLCVRCRWLYYLEEDHYRGDFLGCRWEWRLEDQELQAGCFQR